MMINSVIITAKSKSVRSIYKEQPVRLTIGHLVSSRVVSPAPSLQRTSFTYIIESIIALCAFQTHATPRAWDSFSNEFRQGLDLEISIYIYIYNIHFLNRKFSIRIHNHIKIND